MDKDLEIRLTEAIAAKDSKISDLESVILVQADEIAALKKKDRRIERRKQGAETVAHLRLENVKLVDRIGKLKELLRPCEQRVVALERLVSAILADPDGVALLQRMGVAPVKAPEPSVETSKSEEPEPEPAAISEVPPEVVR